MRDWRGIRAEIGDRVFYATADSARKPKLHEAWVEEVGETHIRVRPAASPFGEMIGNDHEVRWLHRPEYFVVVKGTVLSEPGPAGPRGRLHLRGAHGDAGQCDEQLTSAPGGRPAACAGLPLAPRNEPIARDGPASTAAG